MVHKVVMDVSLRLVQFWRRPSPSGSVPNVTAADGQ